MDCCITTLDAMKNKEVINICDGRRLGFVVDGQIDITQGKLLSIIVPGECNFLGISKGEDILIPWEYSIGTLKTMDQHRQITGGGSFDDLYTIGKITLIIFTSQ